MRSAYISHGQCKVDEIGYFLTYRTRIYPSGIMTLALRFLFLVSYSVLVISRFSALGKLCNAPNMIEMLPEIVSLCIFAFRIKILMEILVLV